MNFKECFYFYKCFKDSRKDSAILFALVYFSHINLFYDDLGKTKFRIVMIAVRTYSNDCFYEYKLLILYLDSKFFKIHYSFKVASKY